MVEKTIKVKIENSSKGTPLLLENIISIFQDQEVKGSFNHRKMILNKEKIKDILVTSLLQWKLYYASIQPAN